MWRISATSCIHLFFFFNDTATTDIYTLSLHDALPISSGPTSESAPPGAATGAARAAPARAPRRSFPPRSEEHTSELQSQFHLVCRLLLEKKKTKQQYEQMITSKHHPDQYIRPDAEQRY